jgi:hypothetical protein
VLEGYSTVADKPKERENQVATHRLYSPRAEAKSDEVERPVCLTLLTVADWIREI